MNYLSWHFNKAPRFILKLIGNYIFFVGHFFSVKIILKTLFSPWKREVLTEKTPGFDLSKFLNLLTFNILSRIIGFIVRISTLFLAFFSLLFVVFFGIAFLIYWFAIPILSLPIFFLIQKDDRKKRENFILSHLEDVNEENSLSEVNTWYERVAAAEKSKSEFWTRENLLSIPAIGNDWAYGYTPSLNKLTMDLSTVNFALENLIGRNKELETIQRVLNKEENPNALLVGEAGAGRKALTIGLAKLILSGECVAPLQLKRILLLDLDLLLARTQAETQQNLITIIEEAKKAGNVILVIPVFDQFISNDPGHINLTQVFSQHLSTNDVQIIGITDPYSYQKYVLPNQTLGNLFEKINISPLSLEDSLIVAQNKSLELERKHKIVATYECLIEALRQSEELMPDIPFPQKVIDIIEEAYVFAKTKGQSRITASDIDAILSQKTKIPLGELKIDEKEILKNLEETLHKRVIGQDSAIIKVSEALKRKRSGVEIKDSPIGTFLFLGSTGVGKTETAKALAQAYFGDEQKLIRLDMSQFQNQDDIGKLIGENDNPGVLTSMVRENPFTVLLLDEFEKADPKILNLFLPILDEGYLTDGKNKRVSFRNTIIIATSNAGSEFIREKLSNNLGSALDKDLIEYLLSNKIFSPELINRFDAVIFYKPLTKEELGLIARLIIEKLNRKLEKDQGIKVIVDDKSVTKLVDMGYDPSFGARNLQRTIQEEIENKVASEIIEGNVKKGSQVTINLD